MESNKERLSRIEQTVAKYGFSCLHNDDLKFILQQAKKAVGL